MIVKCFPEDRKEIADLWREVQELTMIFQKIIKTMEEKVGN
jgi:hypothetical protein